MKWGQGVPSNVEGGGGGALGPSLYSSMGKAQKLGFSCFIEQILAKLKFYAIYFDESHAYNVDVI